MIHDDGGDVIPPGSVFELIPYQPEHREHRKADGSGVLGCWCVPDITAYAGEDDDVDYFVIDHHYVH